MSIQGISEAYQDVCQWAAALNGDLDGRLQHVQQVLSGEIDLPEGCPSRASLAELELKAIYDKLDELNAAAERLREVVWKVGGKRTT